jgi:uncharacterized membrane protein YgcG
MTDEFQPQTPIDSHHPGPPRFVHVGEPIRDLIFVLGADTTNLDVDVAVDSRDRDGLAPRIPELRRTPSPYARDDFEWAVVSAPSESDGDVLSFATPTTVIPRYDHGLDHVAEFEADAPGEYVLALDAPDGVHELPVFAFSEREDCGLRPRPPSLSLGNRDDGEGGDVGWRGESEEGGGGGGGGEVGEGGGLGGGGGASYLTGVGIPIDGGVTNSNL